MHSTIDLQWNHKEFPKDLIGNLNITSLEIKAFQSSKPFMEEVCTLTNLESLVISYGKITKLPSNIAQLKKLRRLVITHNELAAFPEEIVGLTALEELDITKNEFRKLPDAIRQFKKLRLLNIDGNKINKIPAWIGELTALEELIFTQNRLREFPEEIASLLNLKVLKAEGNKIMQLTEGLKGLKNLQYLNLAHNRLNGIPDFIFELNKLEELDISFCKVTKLPAAIGKLTELRKLMVNEEIEVFPDEMISLQKLEEFDFQIADKVERFPEVLLYLPVKEYKYIFGRGGDWLYHYNSKFNASILAADVPMETRRDIYHILNKTSRETQKLTLQELLYASRINNEALTKETQKLLFDRYHKALKTNPLTKESQVAVLGRIRFKKSELKERLKAIGLGYSTSIRKKTTHVVIGKKIGNFTNFDQKGLVYISEYDLDRFLEEAEEQILLATTPETIEIRKNLSTLLLSQDENNVELGLIMANSVGVSKEILTDLFLIYKNTNFDGKLRKNARNLLELKCSPELKEKLKINKKIINGIPNERTLNRNVNLYFKNTGLDRNKLPSYYFEKLNELPKNLVARLPKPLRDELLHHAFQKPNTGAYLCPELFPNGSIADFFNFNTAPSAFLMGKGLSEVPEGFRAFKDLKELNISYNGFRDLPDWFEELENLENLNMNFNSFTKAPAVLAKLPRLKSIYMRECPMFRKRGKPSLEGFRLDFRAGHFWRH